MKDNVNLTRTAKGWCNSTSNIALPEESPLNFMNDFIYSQFV